MNTALSGCGPTQMNGLLSAYFPHITTPKSRFQKQETRHLVQFFSMHHRIPPQHQAALQKRRSKRIAPPFGHSHKFPEASVYLGIGQNGDELHLMLFDVIETVIYEYGAVRLRSHPNEWAVECIFPPYNHNY